MEYKAQSCQLCSACLTNKSLQYQLTVSILNEIASNPNEEAQQHLLPAEDLGFHQNRPVAALVIFRSCLQWKTFQADRTVLFDKVFPLSSVARLPGVAAFIS